MTEGGAHHRIVEAWRAQRYAALRRDMSWLTLAGLDWLRDGVNRVGSAADTDVMLPGGAALAGTLTVESGTVTAEGEWTHAAAPVDGLRLVDDQHGEATLLELGSLRSCVIERGGRLALRTWDLDAPPRHAFDGIDHWEVDPDWCVEARFERAADRTVAVPDVVGTAETKPSPGDVVFERDGASFRLQALEGGERGELWLVFGDATNGSETYGGGRFLYTEPPNAESTVVVDFNRAYNPPCVFTPFATCPLPWPENRLAIRVEAGERAYLPGG